MSIIGTDHRAKEEWYRANSVDMFESLDNHNNTIYCIMCIMNIYIIIVILPSSLTDLCS